MAVKKNHKIMLKKLEKQVRILERKEELAKNKLRSTLAKMRKLSRSYKSKLASKMRMMKRKMAEAQATAYARAAIHLERQMISGIEKKGKALALALNKIEKKYAAKVTKSIAKKGKKTGKGKTASKSKKVHKVAKRKVAKA